MFHRKKKLKKIKDWWEWIFDYICDLIRSNKIIILSYFNLIQKL